MWNSFSHLLDLSHGFQTYGDGLSHSIDSRVVVEFEHHPHPTMLAIRCLQTFSTFFVSHVKIATFKFFKLLKTLWFTKSMLTVSFDKHSMRFCSSFLQMVTENQCCPQIVVSRYKIRHVQRYYKLYCCMKLVLLWVENLCQMSEQGNGVNSAVWRQLHWQLWPSIGKFRFHIIFIYLVFWRVGQIILFGRLEKVGESLDQVCRVERRPCWEIIEKWIDKKCVLLCFSKNLLP